MTRTVLLGNIAEVLGGGTPSTANADYWGGDIPWITPRDLSSHQDMYISTGERSISEVGLVNSSAKLFPAETVIFSSRAPIGYVTIASKSMTTNQGCKGIICNYDELSNRFLFYWLKLNKEKIEGLAGGSTFKEISTSGVRNLEIVIPNIHEQKKIADILGTIDEKIELNRKINETLEQMGQALFRHYFIDNPKAESWEDGTISDLGGVITGKTPSKARAEYYSDDVMFLKVPDMHGQSVIIRTEDGLSIAGADSQSTKYIPKWTTCVSCIATVGVVSLAGERLQTNQQINSIIPKSDNYTFFNYCLAVSKYEELKSMASGGSATPNLNKGQFEKIKVKLPPSNLLGEFHEQAKVLFEKINLNTREVQTLTTIRDILLPRLINGKLKV